MFSHGYFSKRAPSPLVRAILPITLIEWSLASIAPLPFQGAAAGTDAGTTAAGGGLTAMETGAATTWPLIAAMIP